MRVRFAAQTHPGKVRDNNEDSLIAHRIWNDTHLLCCVIDGIGGYEGGEVAAEIARHTILDYLTGQEREDDVLTMLEKAVVSANNAIVSEKIKNPNLSEMGCVATVGLFDLHQDQLYVAHIGDTRLYLFNEGSLQKLTHDHSVVGVLEDIGQITEEEAMNAPNRNLITKSLGSMLLEPTGGDYIDLGIFPVQNGSLFLFCSDGLYDMLTSAEIISIIGQVYGEKVKAEHLIDLANEKGGKDNVTVILAYVYSSKSSKKKVRKQKKKKEELKPEQPTTHLLCIKSYILGLLLFITFIVGLLIGYILKSYS